MMNLSAPEESRGQLYNSPQISHRFERSIKNKKKIKKMIECAMNVKLLSKDNVN
jgi:hypothetical protein